MTLNVLLPTISTQMAKKGYVKDTEQTERRHRELIKAYLMAIQSYGSLAKDLGKGKMYTLAGEKVFLTPRYAGRVINHIMNNNQALVAEVERELIYGPNE
jgi:hypothetical protein